jgi:hypothetical protein
MTFLFGLSLVNLTSTTTSYAAQKNNEIKTFPKWVRGTWWAGSKKDGYDKYAFTKNEIKLTEYDKKGKVKSNYKTKLGQKVGSKQKVNKYMAEAFHMPVGSLVQSRVTAFKSSNRVDVGVSYDIACSWIIGVWKLPVQLHGKKTTAIGVMGNPTGDLFFRHKQSKNYKSENLGKNKIIYDTLELSNAFSRYAKENPGGAQPQSSSSDKKIATTVKYDKKVKFSKNGTVIVSMKYFPRNLSGMNTGNKIRILKLRVTDKNGHFKVKYISDTRIA